MTPRRILTLVSLWGAPACVLAFVALLLYSKPLYIEVLLEDGPAEWLTFTFLCAASLVAARLAVQRSDRHERLFFLVFCVCCFAFAGEEISWGQRVLGLPTPEVLVQQSDKAELNFHNWMQGVTGLKTKHIALAGLGFYGGLLPLLCGIPVVARRCAALGLTVPPRILVPAFLLASLMMIDLPTGEEEEIGELLYAFCLFLFPLHELA